MEKGFGEGYSPEERPGEFEKDAIKEIDRMIASLRESLESGQKLLEEGEMRIDILELQGDSDHEISDIEVRIDSIKAHLKELGSLVSELEELRRSF